MGISSAFLPHLFERFRQAESGTRRPGGLGLGLNISKQLIELHGGTITAESPGECEGATFRITFPAQPLPM
jgi:signal transduction histidine kinase